MRFLIDFDATLSLANGLSPQLLGLIIDYYKHYKKPIIIVSARDSDCVIGHFSHGYATKTVGVLNVSLNESVKLLTKLGIEVEVILGFSVFIEKEFGSYFKEHYLPFENRLIEHAQSAEDPFHFLDLVGDDRVCAQLKELEYEKQQQRDSEENDKNYQLRYVAKQYPGEKFIFVDDLQKNIFAAEKLNSELAASDSKIYPVHFNAWDYECAITNINRLLGFYRRLHQYGKTFQ